MLFLHVLKKDAVSLVLSKRKIILTLLSQSSKPTGGLNVFSLSHAP